MATTSIADQYGYSSDSGMGIALIFTLYAIVTGLSIGVHLLNLLCIPAIVLVYYYKKV